MTGPWLRGRGERPGARARLRLVCLPHAGGAASFFGAWAGLLGPAVEVLAAQYPGREDRINEPCVTSVRELAAGVRDSLPAGGGVPLALFGHSLGSVVAYELARLLHQAGRPVRHLFVSGRHSAGETIPSGVHLGGEDELIAELRRLGGTRGVLLDHPEIRQLLLPAIRADYQAAETYRPVSGRPLACPITALIGDADPEVDAGQAVRWAEHTTGPFELVTFPGDHFYLVPHRREVVRAVAARLGGTPPPGDAFTARRAR